MAIVGQTQTYGHRIEVGHGSHLVHTLNLCSCHKTLKKWKSPGTRTDVTVLHPNPTSNPLFKMCLRQTVTKKKKREKEVRGNRRSLPHMPQTGSTVESTAELLGAGRLESL